MWACVIVVLLFHCLHCEGQPLVEGPLHIPVKVLRENGTCPSDQDKSNARDEILQNILTSMTCGRTIGWRRVGYLDMTDSSQSCPSGLAFQTYSLGLRSCGRATYHAGCWSTFYDTGGSQYSRVCGRVRGYQFGNTGAFYGSTSIRVGFDSYYVDGVSLTHGQNSRRTHIWTFAAAISESDTGVLASNYYCRCTTSASPLPPFVGSDYFCESGHNSPWNGQPTIFYPSDPLWDGQNCIGSCCQFNSPPYFTKTLPVPTSDDIELRICSRSTASDGDIPIDQVELYVQ